MAAVADSSFAALLAEDSDVVPPATDKEVIELLTAYGAHFSRAKKEPKPTERREILAGMLWLHTNHAILHTALARASANQQRLLAVALGLDYDKFAQLESWPALVSRRILAQADPGDTPLKRKAPAPDANSQIVKPGAGANSQIVNPGEPADPAAVGARKQPKASRLLLPLTAPEKDSSDEASDVLSSDSDGLAATPAAPATPLGKMPAALDSGTVFTRLVTDRCALPWLTVTRLEASVPPRHWNHLYKGTAWSAKARSDYDKMTSKQSQGGAGCLSRREDPNNVAFVHRVRLSYTGPAGLTLTGKLLALVAVAEKPSDFSGSDGIKLGGTRARSDLEAILADLRRHWAEVVEAATRARGINSVTIHNIVEGLHIILERRYARFAALFPAGRAREEVLANTARQCAEVRALISDFTQDLNHRGGTLGYEQQIDFIANHYLTLLQPVMDALLGADTGAVPGGISASDLRQSATWQPAAGAPQEQKPLRSALRTLAPAVSFADTPAVAYPTPSLQPSAYYGPPPLAFPYGSWPPFQPPPAYHLAGGSPGYTPPAGSMLGQLPPPAAPVATNSKSKRDLQQPGGQAQARTEKGIAFCSQPLHAYVAGEDSAVVPIGSCEAPRCSCGGTGSYQPGPHATWDCPLRYLKVFGYCPGFQLDGHRDPAFWIGNNLTRAGKDAWIEFIDKKDLPLARSIPRGTKPPNFSRP